MLPCCAEFRMALLNPGLYAELFLGQKEGRVSGHTEQSGFSRNCCKAVRFHYELGCDCFLEWAVDAFFLNHFQWANDHKGIVDLFV